jgi:hypothetical protein
MDDYYDDGSIDIKRVVKESIKELSQEHAQEQAQAQAANQQKEMQSVIEGACAEAGISIEQFNQFIGDRDVFKSHVKNVAKQAASVKRDSKGRFVKRKTTHQEQPSQVGLGRRYEGKRFDPAKNEGTDQDMANMVKDFLGDDPMMKFS